MISSRQTYETYAANKNGTQVAFRKPWTRKTFQSKVLDPLQKTITEMTAISSDKRLVTALIGSPEGDTSNNVKQVLDDFTSKLTRKFKNVDTWAGGVGTWAGTVQTHTHPVSTVLAGAAPPPAGTIAGTGTGTAAASAIGPLSQLMKVTRKLQPIKTSLRNLTGPSGNGSPITADDTRVTLNWFNDILPMLNLTNEEEGVLQVLGSEPKILIELLTRARQGELNIENEIGNPHRTLILVHFAASKSATKFNNEVTAVANRRSFATNNTSSKSQNRLVHWLDGG